MRGHLHCPEGGQACSELKLSSWIGLPIPGSVQSQWNYLFYWKVTLPMEGERNLVVLKIPFNPYHSAMIPWLQSGGPWGFGS